MTLLRTMTERGPRAVPRRGSDWAAPRFARGSLRCSRHKGGCDAARSGAERATASWLLAGPSPAAPDFPSLHCAPRRPRFAPTGHRPRAHDALVVFLDKDLGGAGKAVVGCASAATYAAPRSAGLRGLRVALRRRVGHTLVEHRAQRRCESSVAPARGRVCVAALAARAPQGTLRAAEGAASERRRAPGRGFASRSVSMRFGDPSGARSRDATDASLGTTSTKQGAIGQFILHAGGRCGPVRARTRVTERVPWCRTRALANRPARRRCPPATRPGRAGSSAS